MKQEVSIGSIKGDSSPSPVYAYPLLGATSPYAASSVSGQSMLTKVGFIDYTGK
jgi:hypothetical protein